MNLTNLLNLMQRIVAADKTVLTAVIVQAAVALITSVGLHASASVVGIVSAIVAAGLGIFVHQNFKAKLALAAAK